MEELTRRLAEMEQRAKSNSRRIDKLELNQQALTELTASVKVLASNQDNLKEDVGEIKEDVKQMMEKPGQRWEGLVDKLLFALAGAALAWLLAGAPGV